MINFTAPLAGTPPFVPPSPSLTASAFKVTPEPLALSGPFGALAGRPAVSENPAFRQFRASVPFSAYHKVGNSTAGAWIENYANAVWRQYRDPATPGGHEKIRADALQAAASGTADGEALGAAFSMTHKFLRELDATFRYYLRTFPSDRPIIEGTASMVMRDALGRLSNGLPADNASGTMRYYLKPRLDDDPRALALRRVHGEIQARGERRMTAERNKQIAREIAREAAEKKQAEIAAIAGFWEKGLEHEDDIYDFVLNGRMLFADIADMEKYCPKGEYELVFDRFVSPVKGYTFSYPGGMRDVSVRHADGSIRKVFFSGDYWVYEEPERWGEPGRRHSPSIDGNEHLNVHWNRDPEVQEARRKGAASARRTIG